MKFKHLQTAPSNKRSLRGTLGGTWEDLFGYQSSSQKTFHKTETWETTFDPKNTVKQACTMCKILVLRVEANNATTVDENQLTSTWFTGDANGISFQSQMNACSYGNFEVDDQSRVVTILLNQTVTGLSYGGVADAALGEAAAAVADFGSFDHVAVCLPPGTVSDDGMNAAWTVGGTIDSNSIYNDNWCSSISAQMQGKTICA